MWSPRLKKCGVQDTGGPKTDCFLEVCYSRICWHRIAFYIYLFYLFIYLFDSDHKGPCANTHKIDTRSAVKNKIKFKKYIKIMIIIIKTANATSNHTHWETANTQTSNTHISYCSVFTARRYASAVLPVIVCLSVRLSVRPSQVGVVQRWINLGSHKERHTIAQGL